MAEYGIWLNTDVAFWHAIEYERKNRLELVIVAARCSVCGQWCEQVNKFPHIMHYKYCPYCGAVMDLEHSER